MNVASSPRTPTNMRAAVLLSLLLCNVPAVAAPDAGVDEIPRCGEHKALIRQVELLRAEVARPRGWHERARTDKLKEELTAIERVLDEVETLYGERRAACQARYLDVSEAVDPTAGAHPGYYQCAAEIWVSDEMVRLVRRKDALAMQLNDRRLTTGAREQAAIELRQVQARLDKLLGNTTLYLDPTLEPVDGGIDGVPEGPRIPPRKQ